MKCFVWTHFDLDGVVSYMVLKWFFPQLEMSYKSSLVKNFRDDWNNWLVSDDIKNYDKVFITDLDVSNCADLIDHKNVVIIDHHEGHSKTSYKNASAIIAPYTSCARLIYKTFKDKYKMELLDPQKKLILLADDYDSYNLQFPDSKNLNTIFWNINKTFETFIHSFNKGFFGFTLEQQNIIKLHNQKIEKIKDSLSIYTGKFKIQEKQRTVYSTFATEAINEVSDMLLEDYKADISIVVNTKWKSVHLRRNKNLEDIDLGKLAATLLDGGGHPYSAAGTITEKFLNFTKLMKQIK